MQKIIKKTLSLSKKDFYIKHLEIINPMFPKQLGSKEIEVLACFMALDDKITKEGHFNTLARKLVKKELSLSSGGLSNYLGSMTKKRFLHKNEISSVITIEPDVMPNKSFQGYMYKIFVNE